MVLLPLSDGCGCFVFVMVKSVVVRCYSLFVVVVFTSLCVCLLSFVVCRLSIVVGVLVFVMKTDSIREVPTTFVSRGWVALGVGFHQSHTQQQQQQMTWMSI